MKPRALICTLVLAVAASTAACGGTQGAAPMSTQGPPETAPSASAGILAFDIGARTAMINLVAGQGGGFNFNGFSNGRLKITIPVSWRVTVSCTNQATINHSCAIVAGQSATAPAFPGAATPDPVAGLGKGQTASFSFTPDKVGTFRIVCLVPGHEDAGMWDTFVAVADGTPSVAS